MWQVMVNKLARIKQTGKLGMIVARARFNCFRMQGDPVWRHASEYSEPTRYGWSPAFQAEAGQSGRAVYVSASENMIDDLVSVPMSDDVDPACEPDEYRRRWPSAFCSNPVITTTVETHYEDAAEPA